MIKYVIREANQESGQVSTHCEDVGRDQGALVLNVPACRGGFKQYRFSVTQKSCGLV